MNEKLASLVPATPFLDENSMTVQFDDVVAADPRRSTSARSHDRAQPTSGGIVIGTLVKIDSSGHPLVDFADNLESQLPAARATVPLDENDVGSDVALMFVAGDFSKPVVLGVIQAPQPTRESVKPDEHDEDPPPLDAEIDGRRVVLTAEKEIVLRCGKASITLTRAGKILIRGAFLLSRSSGVNRIKGGSVQIN